VQCGGVSLSHTGVKASIATSFRRTNWLAGMSLMLAVLASYYNAFHVPFFFDDRSAITNNPTIRRLSAMGDVLSPPGSGSAVTGRPLVNLTFAINYALGGMRVEGYHGLNLALHGLSALVLLGLARRTLVSLDIPHPSSAAFAIASLWALHPLQTESVTCVSQRTELLAGLFYLLTLYFFARNQLVFSVASCALGMSSKEVMVTAPLMVLLYDRTFIAGSFAVAWRQRRTFYLCLANTWVVLAYLLIETGGTRGVSAGFGLGISWWSYALKQCEAIFHYLSLAVWPTPLVVDYGRDVVNDLVTVWAQLLGLILLLGSIVVALHRRPVLGFIGGWFFVILAPSSSIVPLVTQTMAEHRMYLPLAGVVALTVAGIFSLTPRWGLSVCLVLAIGCGLATARRNADYQDELSIWSDTVAKRPQNARAHLNLGNALEAAHRPSEGLAQYQEALRLGLRSAETYSSLAAALLDLHRPAEAVAPAEEALRINPDFGDAHVNLGTAMMLGGDPSGAIAHYEVALRLQPESAAAQSDLGNVLLQLERPSEALLHYEVALRLAPDDPRSHNNLGLALLRLNRSADAISCFTDALRCDPTFADAHLNLAVSFAQLGRIDEALAHCEAALRLRPGYAAALSALQRLQAFRASGGR
jgi:tetratricopeptide (TPR) repeat protein